MTFCFILYDIILTSINAYSCHSKSMYDNDLCELLHINNALNILPVQCRLNVLVRSLRGNDFFFEVVRNTELFTFSMIW